MSGEGEHEDLKASIIKCRKHLEFLLHCGHYLGGCLERLEEGDLEPIREEGEEEILDEGENEEIQDEGENQVEYEGENQVEYEGGNEGEYEEEDEAAVEAVEPIPASPLQHSTHVQHYHEHFAHPHMAEGWYPIRTHQVHMMGLNDGIHLFVRYWNSFLRRITESIDELHVGEDQVHMIPMTNIVDFTVHGLTRDVIEGNIVNVEIHRGFISSSFFHVLHTSPNLVCRLWGSLGYHVLIMEIRDMSRERWASTLVHFNYYQFHGHFAERSF